MIDWLSKSILNSVENSKTWNENYHHDTNYKHNTIYNIFVNKSWTFSNSLKVTRIKSWFLICNNESSNNNHFIFFPLFAGKLFPSFNHLIKEKFINCAEWRIMMTFTLYQILSNNLCLICEPESNSSKRKVSYISF